jgi:hypothetical protein
MGGNLMDWKFMGHMECCVCKWYKSCVMAETCPYTAGWQDGQKKLLEYLITWEGHPIDLMDKLRQILKQLEAGNGK